LDIQQLVDRLKAMRAETASSIKAVAAAFAINAAWLEAQTPRDMPESGYVRQTLHCCDDYEVALAFWPPGGGTLPHDHGSTARGGAVRVLRGSLYNLIYKTNEDGGLAPKGTLTRSSGDAMAVHANLIHKMGNPSDSVLAVSLHIYAPAIVNARYWDPVTLRPIAN